MTISSFGTRSLGYALFSCMLVFYMNKGVYQVHSATTSSTTTTTTTAYKHVSRLS